MRQDDQLPDLVGVRLTIALFVLSWVLVASPVVATPRLRQSTVEWTTVLGLRNATVEWETVRGLRNATVEVAPACGVSAGISGDCNSNTVPDDCDVLIETSQDCNENLVPDECEAGCETAEATNIDDGKTVTLSAGGSSDPTEDAQVAFSNYSGSGSGSITVNATTDPTHPDSGGFQVLGNSVIGDTNIANGAFLLRLAVPFDEADLGATDPMTLDIVWYNAATTSWELAVGANTQNSPGHGTPTGDRFAESGTITPAFGDLSLDLGDYGVFWNTDTLKGFVWANVDHTSTFALGLFAPDAPTTGDDTCQRNNPPQDTGFPCSTNADCNPPTTYCNSKSRYISVTPTNAAGGAPTSIQIQIVSMPQFPARIGEIRWAGAEQSIPNSPNPNLRGAPLVCSATPTNARVWTSGVLHLFGTAIVPGSTYHVRMCDPAGANCSAPLLVATGKWGDVVRAFGGGSQPNFGDISSIVDKFRNLPSAPDMARADLVGTGNPGQPNTPNRVANFADISNDVSAFRGLPYPFTVPPCP